LFVDLDGEFHPVDSTLLMEADASGIPTGHVDIVDALQVAAPFLCPDGLQVIEGVPE